MPAAKPTPKQISCRGVQDPRLASPLREIWATPECDAAFTDLERETRVSRKPYLDAANVAALELPLSTPLPAQAFANLNQSFW